MPPLGWVKPGAESISNPTVQDIFWAAGLCEGEASFCGRTARRNGQVVQLPQAEDNIWILQKLQRLFGGRIGFVWKGAFRLQGRKEQYRWVLSGSRARGFMMTIFSLMSPKRKSQIRRALTAIQQEKN